MAALPKPHRIAFLVPEVKVEGPDAAFQREAAILLWIACIEACQRHPRLAVLDAEVTPLFPQDGHFAPQHAVQGSVPTDAFYGPMRREELLWLELGLGAKAGAVRLHSVARDGKHETFDALGPKLGEQIHQVLGAWLTARGLGALPQRFFAATSDDVLATLRVIAPTLAEQARAWALPSSSKPMWSLAVVEGEDGDEEAEEDAADEAPPEMDGLDQVTVTGAMDSGTLDDPDAEIDHAFENAFDPALDMATDHSVHAIESTIDSTLDIDPSSIPSSIPSSMSWNEASGTRRMFSRPLVQRIPAPFKLPALRLLELALRENLGDPILAIDPLHPQALFERVEVLGPDQKDYTLLRKVIASAPGWSLPYRALEDNGGDDDAPDESTPLEKAAAVGMDVLCQPASLEALDNAAARLAADGRADEGLRLAQRAVDLHGGDSRAHLVLVDGYRHTSRASATLRQALASASQHGCPMDSELPWYPDQIHIDLRAADALLGVGRLDEAIALRANRLEGREAAWPAQTKLLASWRRDPYYVARSYAREGHFRGDDARAVEGFGRVEPGGSLDLAILLDALVAMGREDEVSLAWAEYGLGRHFSAPVARLAAARGLLAAGEWRRGLEELWRVELTSPGRDESVAIARAGQLLAAAPIEIAEAALGERIAIGATTLARRMARDIADFVPAAAKSGLVARALGKTQMTDFDAGWLSGFPRDTRSRGAIKSIDALFAELGPLRKGAPAGAFDVSDEHARGDRLVNQWLDVTFAEAGEDDHAALAQAGAYMAAQALGRYLAATTAPPSTIAGALRTVAAGALALVRRHQRALGDREARAVLGAIEPMLRRVDRWLGIEWLGTVERSLGLDERANGDVAGFARDFPTIAARVLGPEETTVLSWSVARMHRERGDGWAARVSAQASRLAGHTGFAGTDEWADAIVAQLAARQIDQDDAIDALHTACYLAEGVSARPSVHAARVLLDAGRAPAALAVLSAGLGRARSEEREEAIASIADVWKRARTDVPLDFAGVARGVFEALQKGDALRAEKLGRWAVALDPDNGEAHRNLGLALASQAKTAEALSHLVRATPEQATQILSGVLYKLGKVPEAMGVLDYASRWYVRADQWLTYGGIAYAAMDNPRTVKAYDLAYQLDLEAFDATQLNAYAGVLDEVGQYERCETVANHLARVAGSDVMWQTNAWNHLACAYIGRGKLDEAVELAERAVAKNPLPDNKDAFAATLERARAAQKSGKAPPAPPTVAPAGKPREPVFVLLEAGDHAAAAGYAKDKSWRVRRAALHAARFRFSSENHVEVTPRARAAAIAVLADSAGSTDHEALLARCVALHIREQGTFARDPVPHLGDRMTREAFYQEFRARGGVVLGEQAREPAPFVDREVVPGSKVARASDYVALLRDLAALAPRDALAQFDLDEAAYIDIAKAWAAAMEADPSIARTISTGLARPR